MRHGTTYQIIDPWTTTDWAAVWTQMVMKRIALGDTIGEAYERGMRACGPEYTVNQWWWDTWENVELFGDPSLRVFVPGTEYSDASHWEKSDTKSLRYEESVSIEGHMPFGVTSYPHALEEPGFVIPLWFVTIIVIILLIIVAAVVAVVSRKHRKK